nr:TIGR04282 family arsenosugar biosynthesis glycosyltransferase [uncultured Desulfobulbus sp.]
MGPTAEIAIMVRVPLAGQVKTRLIPALGAEGACRLYRAMVVDILAQARATGLPLHLFYTGGEEAELPPSWRRMASRLSVQQGADLGARMAHVVACCLQRSPQVVLIGSDIPAMRTETLLQAVALLKASDVALNPAADGGYCLLALNRGVEVESIFQDMPWSTDKVLALTRARLEEGGHRVGLLPPLADIDTPEDLRTYLQTPNPLARQTNLVVQALNLYP